MSMDILIRVFIGIYPRIIGHKLNTPGSHSQAKLLNVISGLKLWHRYLFEWICKQGQVSRKALFILHGSGLMHCKTLWKWGCMNFNFKAEFTPIWAFDDMTVCNSRMIKPKANLLCNTDDSLQLLSLPHNGRISFCRPWTKRAFHYIGWPENIASARGFHHFKRLVTMRLLEQFEL